MTEENTTLRVRDINPLFEVDVVLCDVKEWTKRFNTALRHHAVYSKLDVGITKYDSSMLEFGKKWEERVNSVRYTPYFHSEKTKVKIKSWVETRYDGSEFGPDPEPSGYDIDIPAKFDRMTCVVDVSAKALVFDIPHTTKESLNITFLGDKHESLIIHDFSNVRFGYTNNQEGKIRSFVIEQGSEIKEFFVEFPMQTDLRKINEEFEGRVWIAFLETFDKTVTHFCEALGKQLNTHSWSTDFVTDSFENGELHIWKRFGFVKERDLTTLKKILGNYGYKFDRIVESEPLLSSPFNFYNVLVFKPRAQEQS